MTITLRGETINIELGQEVTFYRYKLNDQNKIEIEVDKVVVDTLTENIIGFKNEEHVATLHYYQICDFYLSVNNKNQLDFLTRKYNHIIKREENLKDSINTLVKLLENLSNDKAQLETLMENTLVKLESDR